MTGLLKLLLRTAALFFCFIFFNCKLTAQLCEGSLGDPVVKIDFGTGFQSLPFALLNYTYTSNTCPNDNFFTIVPSTSGCFGDSWHTLNEDHTPGDNNGNMMLINASFTPGDFYLDTVRGLCGNTNYEFAAWVVNVLKPSACNGSGIEPNITFKIESEDGTALNTFNTGGIAASSSPQWKQYGFFFTTPVNTEKVVIRMTNNAPGGCGNDLALDDITFRPCGPKVAASITDNNNGDFVKNICQGKKTTVVFNSNISSGYADPAYQWQQSSDNGVTWNDITNATQKSIPVTIDASVPAGSYLYRLAVAQRTNISVASCRILSNVLTVVVNGKPQPSVSSNSPVCEGSSITLNATDGEKYTWTGPANFSSTNNPATVPSATFANAGTYHVNVITQYGCTNTDSTVVTINKIPDAVSSSDVTICEGTTTQLHASGGQSFIWQPAATLSDANSSDPVSNTTDTTTYIVTVSNGTCTDTASTTVNILKKPVANAGPDKVMTEGQSVQLDGSAGGTDVNYSWTPSLYLNDPFALQPVASPVNDTTYTLHVQSNAGCGIAADQVFVRVYKKVIIPNAFSPNNDGINDTWHIIALNTYPDADISVFNRYGQIVYHSIGYNTPWNGSYNNNPLPVATYYYVIDLKNKTPKLSGWVFIVK